MGRSFAHSSSFQLGLDNAPTLYFVRGHARSQPTRRQRLPIDQHGRVLTSERCERRYVSCSRPQRSQEFERLGAGYQRNGARKLHTLGRQVDVRRRRRDFTQCD
ncbi:hypothetical protein GQ600_16667 [Phytophthora cactorum]|nr:hypothetical protein GQ600_16667 [Phytophthora cactorum]